MPFQRLPFPALLVAVAVLAGTGPHARAYDIPAERQNTLTMVYDGDSFGRCMGEREDPSDCIGHFRKACGANAQTEEEWFFCIDTELKHWDDYLNRLYKEAMGVLGQDDADRDTPAGDSMRSMTDALRDTQRAWIPYRDALCDFAANMTPGGTTAPEHRMICLSDETARQSLHLGRMLGFND
ncbi:MAG: lysozyme inhibitor LprI family protein [Pseudomonadota bacterium]